MSMLYTDAKYRIAHIETIYVAHFNHECLPHMSLQYGELRLTSGWDRFVSLGHPWL